MLERSRLGPLDVAVLGAADEGALTGWLDEEGFELAPEVERRLAPTSRRAGTTSRSASTRTRGGAPGRPAAAARRLRDR
ncbi:DUF2330 domain-containing protein [Nocardiopsis composta]